MANSGATAPVIPAEEVRVAAGRFIVSGPVPEQAAQLIHDALYRHAGDPVSQTTRLLGMHDLVLELNRQHLLDDLTALWLSTAAFEAGKDIALSLAQPADKIIGQIAQGGDNQ